jgi:hypothetical protein
VQRSYALTHHACDCSTVLAHSASGESLQQCLTAAEASAAATITSSTTAASTATITAAVAATTTSPEATLLRLEHMVVRATVDAATARQDFLERDFAYQRLVREHANVKLVNAQLRERVEVSAIAIAATTAQCKASVHSDA